MNVKERYKAFFLQSDEGKNYVASLQTIRNQAHVKVENEPDKAQYWAGYARGIREAMQLIDVGVADKKNKS